jgi:hypothetical protein
MSVTEVLRGLGQWNIGLDVEKMPDKIWKQITKFGHIAIHVGRVDPRVSGDSLLRTSRYTGVVIGQTDDDSRKSIDGFGINFWLGDSENKGDIRETLLAFDPAVSFQDAIIALLPSSGAVVAGTIVDIPEMWGGSHQYKTSGEDIDYVCQTLGAAWRVNGDATLDAGYESDLFVVNPKTVVMRKMLSDFSDQAMYDMFMKGLSGLSATSSDMEDFTTRVLLLAQNAEGTSSTATADILPGKNPYKDLHGNSVKITRIVQESDTDPANADARAQLQLNRFTSPREALTLSTSTYDVKGDLAVGDYLWVCDPVMDLVDVANEVRFRGKLINPMKLRLTETTWPIVKGYSVLFRDYNGNWIDLTDYVEHETGDTQLVVGGYNRSLTSGGGGVFPVTPPSPENDTTIPDQTEWDTPWQQAMYQSPITGESRSEVELKWSKPLNTDASNITDLDYYEIRYRQSVTPLYPLTIDEMAEYEVDELNTVEDPLILGIEGEWQYARAPGEVLKYRMGELLPGQTYEAQIRAVDTARPPHLGEWSDLIQWQASRDIFPPATPAAPIIASSQVAILVEHHLGRADGGEFNLDRDLHHLKVYMGSDPLFVPTPAGLLGVIQANWGMISGEVPVVGSFQVTNIGPMYYKVTAVDESGNESLPSAGVVATAELIDDQWVRNLRVDKITAGTISADWLLGAYIRTGKTGARVEMSYKGIDGYGPDNIKKLNWDSASGQLRVIGSGGIAVTGGGNIEITDGALIVYNVVGDKIIEIGECADGRHGVQVYKDNGTRVARIGELASSVDEGIEVIDDFGGLVRISTLAFGMESGYDAAIVSTTLTTFNGNTPSCTCIVGNTGRVIVSMSAWVAAGAITGAGSVGFFGSGPSGATVAANINRVLSTTGGTNLGAGRSFLCTGLTPGSWTFSLTYRSSTAGQNAQFLERQITAQPF